jgi:hypothetical protein
MVLNTAVRQKDFGINYSTIPNPADTYLTLQDAITGQDGHTTVQVIRDGIVQNVVAYLTSGATAEWVSGEYAKGATLHFTDPAKLVSGTYVAGAAVAAGVVPPASPWLLSALDGKDGVSAVSTITTTRPNVPAVGSDATYSVGSAAGYGIGMYIDIINASSTSLGTFLIVGITTTSLTLRNVTAIATTTVSTGFTIVASGKPGTNGTNGISAIAVTAGANAVTPAVGASQAYNFVSASGLVTQQYYGFTGIAGTFLLTAIATNSATLQNVDASVGSAVPAGTVLAPVGKTGAPGSGGGSGGATGIKYTLNTAAGTPTAGEIRSTNLAVAGTIAISATDAATPGKSAADILAKVKVGAIIVIAKSQTEQIRATVTTDYTAASGSFAIAAPLVDGVIGNGAIVFLSIASDAPSVSTGSGMTWGLISANTSAVANSGYIVATAGSSVTLPSGSSLDPVSIVNASAGNIFVIPQNGGQIIDATVSSIVSDELTIPSKGTVDLIRADSTKWYIRSSKGVLAFTSAPGTILFTNIRIAVKSAQELTSGLVGTGEIELYSVIGGANIATGGTVSFSEQGAASGFGSAVQAFDGIKAQNSTNTWYVTNSGLPKTITYNLSSPLPVKQIGLSGYDGRPGNPTGGNIGTFDVFGSTDNGVTYALLNSFTTGSFPSGDVLKFTL